MRFPAAPPLKPLDLLSRPRATPRALTTADLSHAARLAKSSPRTQHDQLTAQAQKWVAQTFFGTLLKQMDESPFKSELLSGGRGGEAFGSLYHQQLADRMARGAGHKLVNAVVRRIEARAAYQKQQDAAKQSVPPVPANGTDAAPDWRNRHPHTRRHVPALARA